MSTERDGRPETETEGADGVASPRIGDRTMQVDAMSDELLEELDARPTPNVPIAAPPPLPRRRRWTGRAVAALVGVVIAAALLAVGAAALLFGGDDNAHATGTEAPAGPDPVPEVAPLQLDEFVIESGETDEPAEERTPE